MVVVEWGLEGRVFHPALPARNADAQGLGVESIRRQFTRALLAALAGSAPSTSPRHRWAGIDLSLDELGIFMAVHGVLLHAYQAFLIACGHSAARNWDSRRPRLELPALDDAGDGGAGDVGEAEADDADNAEEVQPEPDAAANPQLGLPIQQEGDVDWAALNNKFRRGGFAFIKRMPLGGLMLLRRIAEPFRVLFAEHFRLGSEAWELKQRAQDAKAIGADDVSQQRQYRVVVAALHTLEDEFVARVYELLTNADVWQHLPQGSQSVRFQALAFRLLSRMGCAAQELLRRPHESFPIRLFLLLADPTLADLFANADACEMDEFTARFVDTFRLKGLDSHDALMTLKVIARDLKIDIAHVEPRHASLRRYLKGVPMAKKMGLRFLSALWACSRYAKRQARCVGPTKKTSEPKRKARKDKLKRRRHGRSSFHAFASCQSSGKKPDFAALHKAFAALTDEERKQYQDMSNASLSAPKPQRNKKSSPFGLTLRQALNKARAHRQVAVWRKRVAVEDESEQLRSICDEVVSSGMRAEGAIAQAAREFRFAQQARRAEGQAAMDAVSEFRASRRPSVSDWASDICVASPTSASGFVPTPMASARAFDFAPDSGSRAETLQAFAKQNPNRGLPLPLTWNGRAKLTQYP